MNLESAEEFYKDVVYREMEASEDHNIFTNYNNFSRDHFVFEQTFKECWKIMKHLEQDKECAYRQRDWYAKKEQPPAIIAIEKEHNKKMNRWMIKLLRKYEKALKANDIDYRALIKEVSAEMGEE